MLNIKYIYKRRRSKSVTFSSVGVWDWGEWVIQVKIFSRVIKGTI